MPQVVSAVVTDAWRAKLAQIYQGATEMSAIAEFQIGEGGWTNPGSGKEPLTPLSSLTALSASGYGTGSTYVFTKALLPGDLVFTAPSRLEIRCYVAAGEANDDGAGSPPEFFELAVFDDDGTMLVYSTFPIEIKTSSKALEHMIYVDF